MSSRGSLRLLVHMPSLLFGCGAGWLFLHLDHPITHQLVGNAQQLRTSPIFDPRASYVASPSRRLMTLRSWFVLGGAVVTTVGVIMIKEFEIFDSMIPVTIARFKQGITSLSRTTINIGHKMMEQMAALRKEQDDLGKKQDDMKKKQDATHSDVLEVKEGLDHIKKSLDFCYESISRSEKRTDYIAQGIRLLTRGLTSLLPKDNLTLQELAIYSKDTCDKLIHLQKTQYKPVIALRSEETSNQGTEWCEARILDPSDKSPVVSTNAQSAVPINSEGSFTDIQTLLKSLQV